MLPTRRRATTAHPHRQALIALCLSQITSWGIVFYAFPVLATAIATDTGWSYPAIMGSFSAGLATSALAGVPVGRLLDRWGPRPVMTTGSVLAVASLAVVSFAGSPAWFAMAWIGCGVAQAGIFYKPAVAAVTAWFGAGRVKALTILMLAGGLASTVFAPVTAALMQHLTWRETYLVLALTLAAITIPLHAICLRSPWQPPPAPSRGQAHRDRLPRTPQFIILAASFALGAFAIFTALICLVPLLQEQGMSVTVAAWALGLSGFGQVLGRLGYGTLVKHTSVTGRTAGVLIAGGIATSAIGFVSSPVSAVMALVLLTGALRGAFTLLEATAVADRWGTSGFGLRYGIFSLPSTLAISISPWAGTVIASWLNGYSALFGWLGVVGIAAAFLAVLATYFARRTAPGQLASAFESDQNAPLRIGSAGRGSRLNFARFPARGGQSGQESALGLGRLGRLGRTRHTRLRPETNGT
ncbi:MFS transporter [Natronoglycomyces albus]|uniref:MFS transporter n=1 Tax=Natronoglycomyces albus TaxID=2811108 RepID=UPI001FE68BC9|nr:MFS transporter [Natronoglycomyces albus]